MKNELIETKKNFLAAPPLPPSLNFRFLPSFEFSTPLSFINFLNVYLSKM